MAYRWHESWVSVGMGHGLALAWVSVGMGHSLALAWPRWSDISEGSSTRHTSTSSKTTWTLHQVSLFLTPQCTRCASSDTVLNRQHSRCASSSSATLSVLNPLALTHSRCASSFSDTLFSIRWLSHTLAVHPPALTRCSQSAGSHTLLLCILLL